MIRGYTGQPQKKLLEAQMENSTISMRTLRSPTDAWRSIPPTFKEVAHDGGGSLRHASS